MRPFKACKAQPGTIAHTSLETRPRAATGAARGTFLGYSGRFNMNGKTRAKHTHRAHNKNVTFVDIGLNTLQSMLVEGSFEWTWFDLSELQGNYSDIEKFATGLARGRGTINGTSEKVKLKEGNYFLNSVSRRLWGAFGPDAEICGTYTILERRQHPDKERSVQYRLVDRQLSLLSEIIAPEKPVVARIIESPKSEFERKLGGYSAENIKGRDAKKWLQSEIQAVVDIYVDELVAENKSLKDRLTALKEMIND